MRSARSIPELVVEAAVAPHFVSGWGRPLLLGDTIVLASGGGSSGHPPALIGLNAHDGAVRWIREEMEGPGNFLAPPCALDGAILILLRTGTGTAEEIHLTPQGAETGRHRFAATDFNPPKAAADGAYVLSERTGGEGAFSVSLRRRGTAVWRRQFASLSMAAGDFVVTREATKLVARARAGGASLWERDTGLDPGWYHGIASDGTTVTALDRDGASHPLIARDLRTGARRWTFAPEGESVHDVFLTETVAVVCTLAGGATERCRLHVRRNDGSPIASTDLPDRGYVRAVSGVHVLLEEGNQLVCRILAEPGAIAWKLALPPHDALTITDETVVLRTPTALQVYRAR